MKRCKGTGKAKGYGCGCELPYNERNGLKTYKAKYGLGLDCKCYAKWTVSGSNEAKEHLQSIILESKKKVKNKRWNDFKQSAEKKSELEEKLQKNINKIARLLDRGHKCLSSGKPLGNNISKYDGGHLISVKANPTIRFNLFNIYGQTVHDNQYLGGNEASYFIGIGETFGKELQDFITHLKRHEPLRLSKEELRDKITISLSLIKWLQLQDTIFSNEERIVLRNEFNTKLGIYKNEYLRFKN